MEEQFQDIGVIDRRLNQMRNTGRDRPYDADTIDMHGIYEAGHRFARGDIADALYYLERALPDTFRGLADIVRQPR